jgi:hypothetical protein
MALICNNPDAVVQTLDALGEWENPVGQGRMASLRPHAPAWAGSRLRDTERWKKAVEILAAADEPPPLTLNG